MAVSLSKGGNISLTKQAAGTLTRVTVALGWDERKTSGAPFDLDASALLVGANGKVLSDAHFIFYNQPTLPAGLTWDDPAALVAHTGDNRTGAGEGDDESIIVNLPSLAPEVERAVFAVTIDEYEARGQNFGQASNSFIRVINNADGQELVRYDLTEDYSTETAMIFGELYRNGAEWKFRAVGQGYDGGLGAIARDFGVNV